MIVQIFQKNGAINHNGNISRYWLFVRGIHRSPVNFLDKGQRREALVFSLTGA